MAVNKNAKKVTSLALAATKTLGEDTRAWFAVAVGKDFIFYIDKKLSEPAKFKDPLKIKKILERLKIDAAKDIKKDSAVAAGTIQATVDGHEMTVKVKANGGGKSTLKALVKDATVKKIVGKVEIVKNHGGKGDAEDEALDKEIREEMKAKGVKGVKTDTSSGEEKIEVPDDLRKALKIYKWWDKEGREALKKIAKKPTLESEDMLQTLSRRIKKYAKEKMYKLFEGGVVWDGALKKLRPKDYDLTKSDLKTILKQIDALLSVVRDLEGHDDFEDDARAIADEVADAAEQYGDLEDIAKRLKLADDQYMGFMDAGKGNIALIKDLVSKFSNDDIKLLHKYVGAGSWDRLFTQIMFM